MTETKVIALCGFKGSGKDSVTDILDESWTNVKFAGALKEMMRTLLRYRGADEETIERMIEGDLKEVPTEYLEGKTCRWAMQSLGTEWGRDCIGESLWVNCFKDKARQHEKVYCTDLRFPNEGEALDELDAVTIRVDRPGFDVGDPHPSEKYVLTLPVKYVINNDSTLEAAKAEFSKIITDEGLNASKG